MKNISQIKIMLLLILGLGGVVQGSSRGDNDPSHPSDRRGPARGLHANVPNEEDPRDDWRRRFCRNHCLIHDASSDNFVIVNNQGTIVFPPRENIFLPSGELAGLKCIKLPLRLFKRLLPQENDSNFYPYHHWMEMYNDGKREEIHRQTEDQNCHMILEDNNFIFVLARGASMLTPSGYNDSYVIVDSQGRFFRSPPYVVDVNRLPRVSVPKAIFEKLTKNPVFTEIALQEGGKRCCGIGLIFAAAIGLSYLPKVAMNCIIGLGCAI
jgi:hypothetical protein